MQSDNKAVSVQTYSQGEIAFMLGEELKKPLIALKAMAEVRHGDVEMSLEVQRALRTIDNVLLFQRISSEQTALSLEPVHLGNALNLAAERMKPLSHAFGCEVDIEVQHNIATVDADMQTIQSGIESLWQAMLSMTERPSALYWEIKKRRSGITITITNNALDSTNITLNDLPQSATSRQPLKGAAGAATDLLAAQGLFASMHGSMRKVTRANSSGFSVTMPISKQLAFV